LRASAKEGTGIEDVLEAIVSRVPPPQGNPDAPLRALIFDSHYDSFKGVIAYVRVVEGRVEKSRLRMLATGVETEPIEIGIFNPGMKPVQVLSAGEVGYVATGLKTVRDCRVGDTITTAAHAAAQPLPGYAPPKPMVFASFYPVDAADYGELKEALEKLQLNDASLTYQAETSQALGYGFRCGFLGLFHLEIIQERIEREFDLDVIATAPSVQYQVVMRNTNETRIISNPAELPDEGEIAEIGEPWMKIQVFTPTEYVGAVLDLVTKRHGVQLGLEYLDPTRVMLTYEIPLSEIIVNFHDQLKSRTRGYASFDYSFLGYRPGDLVKLNILVNEMVIDALTMIVRRDAAYNKGQKIVSKLKDLIPRQLFTVPIQAAADGRVISRATAHAMRKDVLAKCYGGDVTRKKKKLEIQKRGKKRLKMVGHVEIPQEAFMSVLQIEE
jgi:GTP-binding protein LepA